MRALVPRPGVGSAPCEAGSTVLGRSAPRLLPIDVGFQKEAIGGRMLVRRLRIFNVKCFANETAIDLVAGRESPHKWVVVYGDNGLGKRTLLRALGIALTGQPALNTLFPSA